MRSGFISQKKGAEAEPFHFKHPKGFDERSIVLLGLLLIWQPLSLHCIFHVRPSFVSFFSFCILLIRM